MKLCICFGIYLSSKWFHLRLTFFPFLFSNLGLIMAQQTSVTVNCFMAGKWHSLCHPISKMHIVREGPGETASSLRCLSYLINNFLTDIKQLAKTSKVGHSPSPFWCLCQKLSMSFLYFNKTLLHKSSWVIKSGPWSQSYIFFGDDESDVVHRKLSSLCTITRGFQPLLMLCFPLCPEISSLFTLLIHSRPFGAFVLFSKQVSQTKIYDVRKEHT